MGAAGKQFKLWAKQELLQKAPMDHGPWMSPRQLQSFAASRISDRPWALRWIFLLPGCLLLLPRVLQRAQTRHQLLRRRGPQDVLATHHNGTWDFTFHSCFKDTTMADATSIGMRIAGFAALLSPPATALSLCPYADALLLGYLCGVEPAGQSLQGRLLRLDHRHISWRMGILDSYDFSHAHHFLSARTM